MKQTLRLIGDLHGNSASLMNLIHTQNDYDLTIQIGDFGIGFGGENYLNDLRPDKVKILSGNHDNYKLLSEMPHNLGNYGIYDFDDRKIFFVQGAYSIDIMHRTPGLNWWSTEQLNQYEMGKCMDLWSAVCCEIDIVLSHTAPTNVIDVFAPGAYNVTDTSELLKSMWDYHNPKQWYFGHFHDKIEVELGDTKFRCLDINEELVI